MNSVNSGNTQAVTRILRGDNSTMLVRVTGGNTGDGLLLRDPLRMLGLFDFLPLSLVPDASVGDFLLGGGNPPHPPTSRSLLTNLPIRKVATKEGCPICQSDLEVGEDAMVLPCSHQFHPDCVRPWLNENNTCPTCRYELDTDDPAYNEQIRQRRAAGIPPDLVSRGPVNQRSNALNTRNSHARSQANSSPAATGSNSTTASADQEGSTQPYTRETENTPRSPRATATVTIRQPAIVPILPLNPQNRPPQAGSATPPPRAQAEPNRPLVRVTVDPAVVVYSMRTGIPMNQLVPLLIQPGAVQLMEETDRTQPSERTRSSEERSVTSVRVPPSVPSVRASIPNEAERILEAALREYDQSNSRHLAVSEHSSRSAQQAVQPAETIPIAARLSEAPSTETSPSLRTPLATDIQAMVTAAHLQALNNHSQLMQLHSDASRHVVDTAAHQRIHAQAMAAHADLMAAHRQFMETCNCPSSTQETGREKKSQRRESSSQETMERKSLGGAKKRKNGNRNEKSTANCGNDNTK